MFRLFMTALIDDREASSSYRSWGDEPERFADETFAARRTEAQHHCCTTYLHFSQMQQLDAHVLL